MFPKRHIESGLRDGGCCEWDPKAHVSHNVQSGHVGRTHVSGVLRSHRNGRGRIDHESARATAGLLHHSRHKSSRPKVTNTILTFIVVKQFSDTSSLHFAHFFFLLIYYLYYMLLLPIRILQNYK